MHNKVFLVMLVQQEKIILGLFILLVDLVNSSPEVSQILEAGLDLSKQDLQNAVYFLVKVGIILFHHHHNVILRIAMHHHIIHLQHMELLLIQDLVHQVLNFGKLIYDIMMLKIHQIN